MGTPGVKWSVSKAVLRDTIVRHNGKIRHAAKELNVSRAVLKANVDADPELSDLLADLRNDFVESTMDKVEDCINDAMDNRSVDMTNALKAAFFFANNHGKERGYNPPVINQQGDIKITPEQLRAVKEAMLEQKDKAS